MFRCELHRLAGNEALCNQWRDLLTRLRPELRLFGPEWFSAWSQTIGSERPWTGAFDVVAVYCETDGRLVGVMPVAHPKVGLLRVNALGGYFQPWRQILAEPAHESEVGRALGWFMVEMGWSVIQLGPWPVSHKAHRAALSALNDLDMPMQKQSSCDVAIAELPASWEQYQHEVLGTKFLRRLANNDKTISQAHQVEVRHYQTPNEAQTAEMLAALAHIERRSWLVKAPNGRPRFIADMDQRFWTKLTQEALVPNRQLDCWVMFADGLPISFVFALTAGSTRYVIANQYDEDFAAHRPGSLLYFRMFEEGYSRGLTRYDFGTNELHYKQQWGAKYSDRLDTFTVATNRLVAGLWNAGIKIRGLLDGSLLSQPNADRTSSFEPNYETESAEQNAESELVDV